MRKTGADFNVLRNVKGELKRINRETERNKYGAGFVFGWIFLFLFCFVLFFFCVCFFFVFCFLFFVWFCFCFVCFLFVFFCFFGGRGRETLDQLIEIVGKVHKHVQSTLHVCIHLCVNPKEIYHIVARVALKSKFRFVITFLFFIVGD